MVINLSVNTIYLSPLPTVALLAGIRLDPNGGAVSISWDVDFELVSAGWYAISTGAASAVIILETIGEKTAGVAA